MNDLFANEGAVRIAVFIGVLVVMMVLEAVIPRRERSNPRMIRWPANLGVVVVDTIVARLVVPVPPIAAAIWATNNNTGLLNQADIPFGLAVAACIIFLDLVIYWQHVIFHKVPILWRLHRMHHADTDIDATTGIRFHPIEIVLSLLIKIAVVLAFGMPAEAVILFEIILNASAIFNHANFKLPLGVDQALRLVIVTPDMHRVHHSWHPEETNSNYGFNLAIWDRLFHTYIAQPRDGHDDMTIGLKEFRDEKDKSLVGLLMIPFKD